MHNALPIPSMHSIASFRCRHGFCNGFIRFYFPLDIFCRKQVIFQHLQSSNLKMCCCFLKQEVVNGNAIHSIQLFSLTCEAHKHLSDTSNQVFSNAFCNFRCHVSGIIYSERFDLVIINDYRPTGTYRSSISTFPLLKLVTEVQFTLLEISEEMTFV